MLSIGLSSLVITAKIKVKMIMTVSFCKHVYTKEYMRPLPVLICADNLKKTKNQPQKIQKLLTSRGMSDIIKPSAEADKKPHKKSGVPKLDTSAQWREIG